jgi:hypothetical protein
MNRRSIPAMLLALAVPGAGHFYLGRRTVAVAYFCIVVFMFAVGIAVDGDLYTTATSGGAALKMLASFASMGAGLLYFIAMAMHVSGQVISSTYEYGSTFTLTAGLMNLLLVLDCWDIANGRKDPPDADTDPETDGTDG